MRIWDLSERRQSPLTDVDGVLASSKKPLANESLMSRCVAGWVDRTGMGHTVVGRLLLGHTVRGKGWVGSTGHYQDSVV